MKKVLLSIALIAGLTSSAFGVTIDWSLDQILKPTQVNSTTGSGSTVNYELVFKNNGPDSAKIGDTLLYQIGLTYTNNNTIVVAPSASSFYLRLLNRNLKSGDTIHVTGSFSFGLYPYPSVTVNCIGIGHLINAARGLKFESTTITNNTKVVQITWYNPQGWPVSTTDMNAGKTSVYPTVVKDQFTVTVPAIAVGQNITVKVYSILGNLISEKTFAPQADNAYNVNAANLANGTYLVSVEHNGVVSTTKIIVQK